jgi:hypothetical protein
MGLPLHSPRGLLQRRCGGLQGRRAVLMRELVRDRSTQGEGGRDADCHEDERNPFPHAFISRGD